MYDVPDVLRLDATALRVLAHPLRSRLLSQLRLHGPATATELASMADDSTLLLGRLLTVTFVLRLLALQGREAEASAPIANTIELAAANGQGMAAAWAHWAV